MINIIPITSAHMSRYCEVVHPYLLPSAFAHASLASHISIPSYSWFINFLLLLSVTLILSVIQLNCQCLLRMRDGWFAEEGLQI
jgi:hypothetical protein